MPITMKKRSSSTPEIAKDFYSGQDFITENIVFELDNGYLVDRKTAVQRGYTVSDTIQLKEGVRSVQQLSEHLVNDLKIKRTDPNYLTLYKKWSVDLIRENAPHYAWRKNPVTGKDERYTY
jgi:hypothetical protein